MLQNIVVFPSAAGAFELDVEIGDTVHAIVAVYDTGDTFGRDDRRRIVLGLFDKLEDAKIVHEKYQAFVPYNHRSERITAWGFEHNGTHYYVPWLGYFEQYIDCYVTALEVRHA